MGLPGVITLRTVEGPGLGSVHRFGERSVCIVGRDPECQVRLPDDPAHAQISRYHCLLDINPPEITVRDFGSLNGTFVNGQKIGQRAPNQSREAAQQVPYPQRPLTHGDRIMLGKTVFEVHVELPAAAAAPAVARGVSPAAHAAPAPATRKCPSCGAVQPAVGSAARWGEQLCDRCRERPGEILKDLLRKASADGADVRSIRGFAILKELGRGGMGAVYLARHEQSGEHVALKVMLPRVAAQEAARQMFLREVEVMLALQHPHVVTLRDVGCSAGIFFVTLEFCDGGSVDQYMQRQGGRLPVSEALRITLQALDGLAYAHALRTKVRTADGRTVEVNGLVHRDIKPGNLFLSGPGRVVKVADFGMAKAFDVAGLSGQTCTGSAAGTPVFMPRQQVLNFKYAKPDVDVWAIAASFYHMVTGVFPRDFVPGVDPWMNVLKNKPVPILQRLPSLPKPLAKVIDAALVDQPAIGIGSCDALKKALQPFA